MFNFVVKFLKSITNTQYCDHCKIDTLHNWATCPKRLTQEYNSSKIKK